MSTRPQQLGRVLALVLVLALALALVAGIRTAQADDGRRDETPRIEASLGAGNVHAFEKSLFNLPGDAASTPDVALDFRVRQNVTRHFAYGFHAYGTTERTPSFFTPDASGGVIHVARYRLTIFHVGADARWMLLPPPLQPYVEAGVSYVSGSLENGDREVLRSGGVSIGGGPGVQYVLTRHWAAGAQGLCAAGSAKWRERPFLNSSSREYDAGFAGAEGFVTFRWFH